MIRLLIKRVQRLQNMCQIHAHSNSCRCNQNHIPKAYIKYLTSFWLNQTIMQVYKFMMRLKRVRKETATMPY